MLTLLAGAAVAAADGPGTWRLGPVAGELAGWACGTGAAVRDGSPLPILRFDVKPGQDSAQARQATPLQAPGWHWYRLGFTYRLAPGAKLQVGWEETDPIGVVHVRGAGDRLALAPVEDRTAAACEFLSRPDRAGLGVTFLTTRVAGADRAAWAEVTGVTVTDLGEAPAAVPVEIAGAVLNGGFESLSLLGYCSVFEGAEATIVTATDAWRGNRYWQHVPGPGGKGASHAYLYMLHDLVLERGHLYRLSARIRGPGNAELGFHAGGWLRDERRNLPLPGAPDAWRPIQADLILDRVSFARPQCLLLLSGKVDVDDIRLERVR